MKLETRTLLQMFLQHELCYEGFCNTVFVLVVRADVGRWITQDITAVEWADLFKRFVVDA